jgi:cell division protein FtsI/penicillin-binding protein 2
VSKRLLTGLLLLALTLTGCTGGGEEGDPAGDAAKAFLAAWASGDTAAAGNLTDDPAAAQELLDETTETLHVTKAELTAKASKPGGEDAATVPFHAALALESLGTWAYDGSVPVVRTGERWLVHWAPSVVHPELSAETRLTRERTLPERAPILDRNGKALMAQRPVVEIGIEPRKLTDPKKAYELAQNSLDVDAAKLGKRVDAAKPDHFVPVITLRRAEFDAVRAQIEDIDGFIFREAKSTLGPTAGFARGVLGTVPPATAETLEKAGSLASEVDAIGSTGLEAAFQQQLAGEPSGAVKLVARENRGVVKTLEEFPGKPGTPLKTSLDLATQTAAERALAGLAKRASLVAVRPSTGEILAAANTSGGGVVDASNRAFEGRYPPGSTFKVVTTAALLGRGLDPDETVPCPQTETIEGKKFENQDRFVLGSVPFRRDFTESCNTAFVRLAQDLPADALTEAGTEFGLGAEWDLGLPAFSGDVPSTDTPVEKAAASIGQGEVLASPLAMAQVAGAVVSGSARPPVLLPDRAGAAAGAALPKDTVTTLRSLMLGVVQDGSAKVLDLPGAPVAAKTGTAEYGDANPPRTHAWIIGFRGDLAFALVIEDGGSGGRDAAPVAKEFLEKVG